MSAAGHHMEKYGRSQAIRRKEDQRFLTGTGRYTADIAFEGQARLIFLRSPHAHGRIVELDVTAARAAPGVIAVYTAAELDAGGVRDLPGAAVPEHAVNGPRKPRRHPVLARDRVRYVGEPIAAVLAETEAAARDAAELILVEVEDLPALANIAQALREGAPLIHDDFAANVYGSMTYGDADAVERIFASARHRVAIDVVNNRIAPTAMEPRGCNVHLDERDGCITVYQGCQGVHALRRHLLETIDIEPEKLRVISPDVGGAFGLKYFLQCETVVAVFACRDAGRPVLWLADRSESFLADLHGRDHLSRAELALDDDGRFLAMKATIKANIGAWCSQAGPMIPWFGAGMSTGVYAIPAVDIRVQTVFTNTAPIDAYRGAGRPEAAYLIERLVDKAAGQLGMDRVALRRINFVPPSAFPWRSPTGRCYDSGNYEAVLDGALARADWVGFAARRASSAAAGKLRGIGLACYVEICAMMGEEAAWLEFRRDGRLQVRVGTQSTGQGHETSYAQLAAARLGIAIDQVDVIQGDSLRIPEGAGTVGSRSMAIGGSAVLQTMDELITAGKRIAGELLEADSGDIEYMDACFTVIGTDRRVTLEEAVRASFDEARRPAGVEPGLAVTAGFSASDGTFPNGCHVCEVELDPETGAVEILRYTVEDDVGRVINPLILEGQIVGGVGQGLGQALGEQAVYDDDGQLLTATFMDYCMPRADALPAVAFRSREVPSPRNPLGVKGAGEAGTVGAAPALVNAVLDALGPGEHEGLDMPLTAAKIWRVLNERGRPESE